MELEIRGQKNKISQWCSSFIKFTILFYSYIYFYLLPGSFFAGFSELGFFSLFLFLILFLVIVLSQFQISFFCCLIIIFSYSKLRAFYFVLILHKESTHRPIPWKDLQNKRSVRLIIGQYALQGTNSLLWIQVWGEGIMTNVHI